MRAQQPTLARFLSGGSASSALEGGGSAAVGDSAAPSVASAASVNSAPLAPTGDVATGGGGGGGGGGSEPVGWSCAVCTFVNLRVEAPVCEVCRSERHHPPVDSAGAASGHRAICDHESDREATATAADGHRSGHGTSANTVGDDGSSRSDDTPSAAVDFCLPTAPLASASASGDDGDGDGDGYDDGDGDEGKHDGVGSRGKRRRVIGSFGGSLLPPAPSAAPSPQWPLASAPAGGGTGACDIIPTANPHLDGLYIVHDFVDEATEAAIVAWLDSDAGNPWRRARFNGKHLHKGWGVRTDLGTGRVRLPRADEPAFPPPCGHLDPVVANLRRVDFGRLAKAAAGWVPNECNANMYVKDDGHYLAAHFDHRAVSGPMLATLSLAGDATMTFRRPGHADVRVDLPRRSIQFVCRTARYSYTHEIAHGDVRSSKRVSITFRMSKVTA